MDNQEEKFEVLVFPERYSSKEEAVLNTGKIKKGILKYREELSLSEIAQKSISGFVMSFIGADREKGTLSSGHWLKQRIFALDCDNTFPTGEKFTAPYYTDYNEAVFFLRSKGVRPAFIYTTGSSTKDHNKYRIVFVLDEEVSSTEERERVTEGLFNLFSKDGVSLADRRCRDAGRIFYPGKNIVYENYEARTKKSLLLTLSDTGKACCENRSPKTLPGIKHEKVNRAAALIEKELEAIKNGSSLQKECIETLSLRDFLDTDFWMTVESLIYNISLNRSSNNISGFKQPAQKSVPANPLRVGNPEDFFAICRKLDIAKLLNLPKGKNFSCIFHEDRKPSAHIVRFNGAYFYKCFSCGHCFNIFGLFEKLFDADFSLTLKWISRKFNIVYESDWQREQKELISIYRDYMLGRSLEKNHPVLASYLEKCRLVPLFAAVSDIARMYVADRGSEGTEFNHFYMAQSVLVRVINRKYGLRKSRTALQKGLIKLAHLGLIRILGDDMIPGSLRHRLYGLRKDKQKYRISVYSIPVFSMELMDKAERTVIRDREKGIRSGTLCVEGMLRSSGRKETEKIYVQSAERKRNSGTEEFYKRYRHAAEKLISENGWTTEQNILKRMKWPSASEKKRLSAVCLPQLLEELNLKRTAFSKEIEDTYRIKTRKKFVYGISRVIISK